MQYVEHIGTTIYQYDVTNILDVGTGEVGEITIDPRGDTTIRVYDKVGRLKRLGLTMRQVQQYICMMEPGIDLC